MPPSDDIEVSNFEYETPATYSENDKSPVFRHCSPAGVGERAPAAAAPVPLRGGRRRDPGCRSGLRVGPPPRATAPSCPSGSSLLS